MYSKKWYLEHKKECQERNRKYYKKHKKRSLLVSKKWKAKNIDKVRTTHKLYAKKNKKRIAGNHKKWRMKNPDKLRKNKLWARYHITSEQYMAIFDRQKGCCAICNIHYSKLKSPLYVDHNHKNKIVRGLLCNKCNFAIGLLNESKILFNNALNYLYRGIKEGLR